MEKLNIDLDIKRCDIGEMNDTDRMLVETAKQATDNSYSPYSHFSVGAAVLLADGTVVKGANQENAAFSVTICAERSAIFAAQAQYPQQPIKAIAIAARNAEGFTSAPVSPCGSCRQAMVEIEMKYAQPLHILLYGEKEIYVAESIRSLMPLCFTDF